MRILSRIKILKDPEQDLQGSSRFFIKDLTKTFENLGKSMQDLYKIFHLTIFADLSKIL